jgi:hypothetical protein
MTRKYSSVILIWSVKFNERGRSIFNGSNQCCAVSSTAPPFRSQHKHSMKGAILSGRRWWYMEDGEGGVVFDLCSANTVWS